MQMLIELAEFWECPFILLATEDMEKGKDIWCSWVATIYFSENKYSVSISNWQ